MPYSSGYSIQRNEVINIPHRSQLEVHSGKGTTTIYPLRSKIDYKDKDWEWEIKVGEVRYSINREYGQGHGSNEDYTFNDSKTYTEGSVNAGSGSVHFVRDAGEFGALIFADEYAPDVGENVEIRYQEHEEQWTGTDGGLLYQMAKDLTVHPYDSPELFKVTQDNSLDTNGVYTTDLTARTELFHPLTTQYNEDYTAPNVVGAQRQAKAIWKVVREWRAPTQNNVNVLNSSDTQQVSLGVMPFTLSDLGDGEFRVSVDNKVVPSEYLRFVSTTRTRTTNVYLQTDLSNLPWIGPEGVDTLNNPVRYVKVDMSFNWKHSQERPYGALVGLDGNGPEQDTLEGTDSSFLSTDFDTSAGPRPIVFNPASKGLVDGVETISNASVSFAWMNATVDADGDTATTDDITTTQGISLNVGGPNPGGAERWSHVLGTHNPSTTDPEWVELGDLFLVEFEKEDAYMPAFNLIYPKPLSNDTYDVEYALKQITDKVLLESAKGVDLLSDDLLTPDVSAPSSNRRPQKWRLRLEWDRKLQEIKIHVATSYQLLDNMTVTKGQGRDGIKSPIYREPGELCDVYHEPVTGRGGTYKVVKSKSQFFRRTLKTQDEVARTYPMSYRITVTDHGMAFFLWEQASVDQDDDYAWFVVQRHVDQVTGQPEFSGKSPVHCVYSPTKRPVEIAHLNTYYASQDTNDLTKTKNVYTSMGQVLETEGPTLWFDQNETVFNGDVNAIDFTGKGYFEGVAGSTTSQTPGQKLDLDIGIIGGPTENTRDYWSAAPYERDPTTGDLTLDADGNPQDDLAAVWTDSTGGAGGTWSTDADDWNGTGNTWNFSGTPKRVSDLSITGFSELPRYKDTSDANVKYSSEWLLDQRLAPSYSGNSIFPENIPERISKFVEAANATYKIDPATGQPELDSVGNPIVLTKEIPNATTGASVADWEDPSYALLDILYNESVGNQEKVLESLIVALDGTEIKRDTSGFILNYDQWVREGDPATVGKFIDALDGAGVKYIGSKFKLPAIKVNNYLQLPEKLQEIFDSVTCTDSGGAVTPNIDLSATTGAAYDPTAVDGGGNIVVGAINPVTKQPYNVHFVVSLWSKYGWLSGQTTLVSAVSHSGLIESQYAVGSNLSARLPGDPVWSEMDPSKNIYMYDFFNQTLHFRSPPRQGAQLVVKLLNYVWGDPAGNAYYITTPPDRDFPERNQNFEKTINRFVVREQDVLKPWDYHVSATMHEIDSNAIINPQEQLSITQDRDFVFSFPTQITTQRFYYPRSELDLITISSADFSTQSGHIEIDKYDDSDGSTGAVFQTENQVFDPTGVAPAGPFPFAGHVGPDGQQYYWKRNKRKYEGMMSTQPNGNGMRVFVQVAGSSIKFTDTPEGSIPV